MESLLCLSAAAILSVLSFLLFYQMPSSEAIFLKLASLFVKITRYDKHAILKNLAFWLSKLLRGGA